MTDFTHVKWAEWMEDTIRHMVEDDIDRAMLIAFRPDGVICTSTSPDICVNDLALGGFWLTDEAHRLATEDDEGDCDAEEE